MSDTDAIQPAQRLASYVDSLLRPGQSVRNFCEEHGLDNARISAWRKANDVTIEQMREFGKALDLKLGQVMVIAGYGTPEDFGAGAVPPAPKPRAPRTVAELLREEGFTDEELEHVLGLIQLLRDARGGRGGTYSSRSRKTPKR